MVLIRLSEVGIAGPLGISDSRTPREAGPNIEAARDVDDDTFRSQRSIKVGAAEHMNMNPIKTLVKPW